MATPEIRYTTTHEWVKIEGALAVVGISDHAQDALGDITFIELPAVGKKVLKGKECSVIESVKAASDLYAPVSGEIADINTSLESAPERINADPLGKGWIFKIKGFSVTELNDLMDEKAYMAFLEQDA